MRLITRGLCNCCVSGARGATPAIFPRHTGLRSRSVACHAHEVTFRNENVALQSLLTASQKQRIDDIESRSDRAEKIRVESEAREGLPIVWSSVAPAVSTEIWPIKARV